MTTTDEAPIVLETGPGAVTREAVWSRAFAHASGVMLVLAALLGVGTAACGDESGAPGDELSDIRSRPDTGDVQRDFDEVGEDVVEEETGPVDCVETVDCFDENPCTLERCEDGLCVFEPDDRPPSQIRGNCRREICAESELRLESDDSDVPADDGFECTDFSCNDGVLAVSADDRMCDDGDRCNGIELCDLEVGCRSGLPVDFDEDGLADVGEDPSPPDVDSDGITDCADWETCDGIDNDQNGLVDDGPTDEELGTPCYEGPNETNGVGVCGPGTLVCLYGDIVCSQQVLPAELELCDGLDNDCDGDVPEAEVEAQCRQSVVFEPDATGAELMLVELSTALRAVDVHFNIDTTGSMSGALTTLRNSLRTAIVPGVAEVIPDVAFGVSTFEDYPVYNFGSGTDLPYELWQRVTTNVDLVQDALSRIDLGSGNDIRESGIESLYQIATGAGTRWPRTGTGVSVDPSGLRGFPGVIEPAGDVDYYRIEASPGTRLDAEIYAARAGSVLDSVLEVYDSTGALVARNDDSIGRGTDSFVTVTLSGVAPFYMKVAGWSGASAGWYYATVELGTENYQVPAESTCSGLEVGADFFAGTGGAVPLEPWVVVTPRETYGACFEDCLATILAVRVSDWIRSFCLAGGTPMCPNGRIDEFEECDDNNSTPGDGCSPTCGIESDGVPPFNFEVGFDPALGHGVRGGAGFREDSFAIIVHATDAGSHDQADYLERDEDIEAHGTLQTFLELEKLGARIVGIATRNSADAPISDLLNPPGMAFRTRALVPACAFDDSEPRTRDVGNSCSSNIDCFSRRCQGGLCAPSCEEGECCVGIRGAGQPPAEGAGGLCPLSFEMDGTGSGLTDGVVRGIQALARFATYRVTPVFVDDPTNARDARCFIQSVEVAEVIIDDDCVPELEFDDRDGDGTLETVVNATPQSRVIYAITVENRDSQDFDGDLDTYEPCGPPGTYRLTLEVRGDDVVVLSSTELEFVIAD